MKYRGIYWTALTPVIRRSLRKRYGQERADSAIRNGKREYRNLLSEQYPERHYTGIDLSPGMLDAARAKGMRNVTLVHGDCEQLPFPPDSFDVVICSQSFHHYPNPQMFFRSVFRVLRPGGRLILRDMTMAAPLAWIANHLEMPLAHLLGHGDVRVYPCAEVRKLCESAGLIPETVEQRRGLRLHCVARKPA